MRQRKGLTRIDAEHQMKTHNVFGMMMVEMDDADGLISGLTQHYPEQLSPHCRSSVRRMAQGSLPDST